MSELITPTRQMLYRAGQKADFLAQLTLDNKSKVIINVTAPEAAYLNNLGLFGGKYQMTQIGAEQYLGELAKGLYQTVKSLDTETHQDIDVKKLPALVAQLVNRILLHRFPAIQGRRAVCCSARKQLDGFVSPSYAMVTNEQVYDLFSAACDVFKFRTQMLSGALHGRDMTAVMLAKDPIKLTGMAKSGLYVGALCQNGETAGRAIRATTILLDAHTRSWSAAPFDKALRIPHTKSRKLRDKMMAIGDTLATKQLVACSVAPKYAASATNAVSRRWDEESIKAFRAKLHRLGDHYYVSGNHIDTLMLSLPDPGRRPPSIQAVYHACLLVADKVELGMSVPMRQLAYRLVFG